MLTTKVYTYKERAWCRQPFCKLDICDDWVIIWRLGGRGAMLSLEGSSIFQRWILTQKPQMVTSQNDCFRLLKRRNEALTGDPN